MKRVAIFWPMRHDYGALLVTFIELAETFIMFGEFPSRRQRRPGLIPEGREAR
jgi:hypothetical protein